MPDRQSGAGTIDAQLVEVVCPSCTVVNRMPRERLTGIPGYPARAVVTDGELKAGIDGIDLNGRVRVAGESDKIWFRSPVDPTVWCKGDTSSDEMDGHYFAWYLLERIRAEPGDES